MRDILWPAQSAVCEHGGCSGWPFSQSGTRGKECVAPPTANWTFAAGRVHEAGGCSGVLQTRGAHGEQASKSQWLGRM